GGITEINDCLRKSPVSHMCAGAQTSTFTTVMLVVLAIYCESIPGSLGFTINRFDCALSYPANASGKRDTGRARCEFQRDGTDPSQFRIAHNVQKKVSYEKKSDAK